MANILFIDNFDSFIYNLVDHLRVKKHKVIIFRNDTNITIISDFINNLNNPIIMLSPGPGLPKNAGCILSLIKMFKGKIPIVGICLGFQAIVETYGGKIKPSGKIMHGKTSLIKHDQKAMFKHIPSPFIAGRYHSLMGTNISNKKIIVNAYYEKIPMAVRDDENLICGFQFHPESILTPFGNKIIDHTIKWIINEK
ncbi:aminodeoxychorismate/anthranilate synthase component II (plasmid) [Buchnera aphidicola (Thelaxes californica)]|uniref:anthranilate synthase n=1 Tax=Buchnera aphidicola (Thelaxes californica) TaxID=1315998 RepID=A0A4D6YDA3_9GAMM|nr:aminodeoxychorismate/anthranilate synthase component II [Buchnera aphidicola]QCI27012.1 aminodeoxychorismate/anthranilate synthase component II [Buchnera aphidicola (Thelaxes californica)]